MDVFYVMGMHRTPAQGQQHMFTVWVFPTSRIKSSGIVLQSNGREWGGAVTVRAAWLCVKRRCGRKLSPMANKLVKAATSALDLAEVVLGLRGLHGLLSRLPASRAHLIGVGLDVLDGLQHTLCLLHGAAEAQVVNGGVLRVMEGRRAC